MSDGTYTMNIEAPEGVINQHPYHLGTIHYVAEALVIERLQSVRSPVVSIALYQDGKLVKIYDHRDLEDWPRMRGDVE